MNIQSLSVCVPAKRCINDCLFCCSKMHPAEYDDHFSDICAYSDYADDLRKRLQYARENDCNTCMLTGNNEPQQNREFLRVFGEINKSLSSPFLNIEMQTSGAFINEQFLDFLKYSVGVTTIAISVACLDSDTTNRSFIQTKDDALCLEALCRAIKQRNINLRICLNMNDSILVQHPFTPQSIIDICQKFDADQITFRALWSAGEDTPQGRWIRQNVTIKTAGLIEALKADILRNGRYLDTLTYGTKRYDFHGFSVVIDEDSMSKEDKDTAIKYLILRQNGHLYSKWDSKASLIF